VIGEAPDHLMAAKGGGLHLPRATTERVVPERRRAEPARRAAMPMVTFLGMVNRDSMREWIVGYERAWRTSAGPELDRALSTLFAPDATYSQAPFRPPRRGLPDIARMWEAERKGADEPFTMAAEIVAVDAEANTGVVLLEVQYGPPTKQLYRDLWIVRFESEGRCEHFEEWPFSPPRG
jgi:hypothetical protein